MNNWSQMKLERLLRATVFDRRGAGVGLPDSQREQRHSVPKSQVWLSGQGGWCRWREPCSARLGWGRILLELGSRAYRRRLASLGGQDTGFQKTEEEASSRGKGKSCRPREAQQPLHLEPCKFKVWLGAARCCVWLELRSVR